MSERRWPRYYDRQGQPIDGTITWARMFEDTDYRRVAEDFIGDLRLSTIWLGFDMDAGDEPPCIFETMLFAPDEVGMWRYPTERAALRAHQDMVEYLSEQPLPGTIGALTDIAKEAIQEAG